MLVGVLGTSALGNALMNNEKERAYGTRAPIIILFPHEWNVRRTDGLFSRSARIGH
jgi:hypothetical protein